MREAKKKSNEGPRYVGFFIPIKRGVNEKRDKKQLNFHMCAFIVEAKDDSKNGTFYASIDNMFFAIFVNLW